MLPSTASLSQLSLQPSQPRELPVRAAFQLLRHQPGLIFISYLRTGADDTEVLPSHVKLLSHFSTLGVVQ